MSGPVFGPSTLGTASQRKERGREGTKPVEYHVQKQPNDVKDNIKYNSAGHLNES